MKVSDLEGAQLDYWVMKIEGWRQPYLDAAKEGAVADDGLYSRDWAVGGPIIERERIDLRTDFSPENPGDWVAMMNGAYAEGKTPLIAAMRCFVASKFGDEVPDEAAA